jgi:hypothetical protein
MIVQSHDDVASLETGRVRTRAHPQLAYEETISS